MNLNLIRVQDNRSCTFSIIEKGDEMKPLANKSFILVSSICMLSLLILFCCMFRFASPYAGTFDSVDFALALSRYDLLAMQPHFPGYPYFILGGMLIHQFIDNPVQALGVFNVLMMVGAMVPVYLLCRRNCSRIDSVLLVTVVMTASYVSVFVTQPMSEGAALAVLWWYFWSLQKAAESKKQLDKILPLFLFSILMGIRLSYLPFGFGIVLLWWNEWRQSTSSGRIRKIMLYIIILIVFQLIWIMGVAMTEDGIVGFMKLGISFAMGHFTEWGGTAVSDSNVPVYGRILHLIFTNLIWTGLSASSIILLILYVSLVLFFLLNKGYKKNSIHPWVKVMGIIYFIWALFGQNVDKPRHILPLIGITMLFLLIPLLKIKRKKISYLIICLLTLVQTYVGTELIKQQGTQPPATYQLATYLEQKSKTEQFIIYTWEEARIMDYLKSTYYYKEIFTYDYFLQDKNMYPNKKVYVTDHVLKGFEAQGMNIKNSVKKVAEFNSNQLFDPIYGEIILYEWIDSK